MTYIRRSFRDQFPHAVPPTYLDAMPPMAWFWDEFGANMAYVVPVWERQYRRVKLSEAQNWRCCYCGCDVTIEGSVADDDTFATFEHVLRKCEGGEDDESNLTIACVLCNTLRRDTPAEDFGGHSVVPYRVSPYCVVFPEAVARASYGTLSCP